VEVEEDLGDLELDESLESVDFELLASLESELRDPFLEDRRDEDERCLLLADVDLFSSFRNSTDFDLVLAEGTKAGRTPKGTIGATGAAVVGVEGARAAAVGAIAAEELVAVEPVAVASEESVASGPVTVGTLPRCPEYPS